MNKKKRKQDIISRWGKTKDEHFSFELIEQYAHYKNTGNEAVLSDKTIIDLDFYDYFKFVDRTNSYVGQQFLYHKLINNSVERAELSHQEKYVQHYKTNVEERLKTQMALQTLTKDTDYYFPYLTFATLPEKKFNNSIILALQLSIAICFIFLFINPIFLIPLILLFSIHLCLHYLNKSRIGKFTIYFARLTKLSKTLKTILAYSPNEEARQSKLRKDIKRIDNITSQVLFLKTDELQQSEFGSFFWFILEIFKILSLSEIVVFNKLVDKIGASRTHIESIFTAIGEIDQAISICSLRAGLSYYSIPNFLEETKELECKDLYHPLIEDCVSNDLHLNNKSLLLTGSNMAGKSTFIKAINLNVISAQVLNTAFSSHYAAPPLSLMTSMTIKDKLNDSSSYYMEEVYSIGELINSSEETSKQYLFTIDEIFKGTNTIERISTAKAILQYLNKSKHIVLVSTHDIELTKLLQEGYDLYFFQESIHEQNLAFDYRLKKGALQKSNAIKILEIAGYPNSITQEAKELANILVNEKTGIENISITKIQNEA